MLEWLHDRTVTEYLQLDGSGATLADAACFIQSAQNESVDLHRAVVDCNDTYLGTVSLKNIDTGKREAEYAIAMRASAMGTGAAFAATQDILNIAFQILGLRRVYLNVLQETSVRSVFTTNVVFSIRTKVSWSCGESAGSCFGMKRALKTDT